MSINQPEIYNEPPDRYERALIEHEEEQERKEAMRTFAIQQLAADSETDFIL